MQTIRNLLLAAAVATLAAVTLSAPASAGVCDQQGKRTLINGVWHKIVRVNTSRGTRLIDCPAW